MDTLAIVGRFNLVQYSRTCTSDKPCLIHPLGRGFEYHNAIAPNLDPLVGKTNSSDTTVTGFWQWHARAAHQNTAAQIHNTYPGPTCDG